MIKGIKVEWNNGYGNEPDIHIEVDKLEDDNNFIYDQKDNLVFAEYNGFVRYLALPKNENYGACFGELRMRDGTIKNVGGCWSSRCEVMNKAGFTPSTETTLIIQNKDPRYPSYRSGNMTNARLIILLKQYLPDLIYFIDEDSGRIVIPKNQPLNRGE